MSTLTVYGDLTSGNCLKVKWVADHLKIATRWHPVSVLAGETRSPRFLAISPAGKVPVVVLADGRVLSESNAIINFLAEGSSLIPKDSFQRARMWQWMFWEQYSHEPYIAVRRFQLLYLRRFAEQLDPKLLERGRDALRIMEHELERSSFMVADRLTLADVALVAYTRLAPEGGFNLSDYPAVCAWIRRVEVELDIVGP